MYRYNVKGPVMKESMLLIIFLAVTLPLEIAQCQDEEDTIEICTLDWQESGRAGSEDCLTLQQYINITSHNFSSDGILFKLLPGKHMLNGTERLVVSNTNFTLVSDEEATLDCSESDITEQHNIAFLDNGFVEINSTNVIGCRFYFSDINTITINGGYFSGVDTLSQLQSPAITVNGSREVTIRRWSCSNYDDGCLNLARASLFLSDSNLTNNSNTAVRIVQASPVNISMCMFSDNRGIDGGVINAFRGDVFIKCTTFKNNVASSNGGVIYVDRINLYIISSIFSNNSAGKHGGVLFVIRAEADVYSSTLSNNTATISGGAGYVRQGSIFINQTNFLGNNAENQSNFLAICDASIRIVDYNQQGKVDQNDATCTLYNGNISTYRNYCPDTGDTTDTTDTTVGVNLSSVIIGVSVAVLTAIVVIGLILSLICYKRKTGGESTETTSERLYESIPDGVWQSPSTPVHVHITGMDPDADTIRTTPNKLYGMQINTSDEQDELSYTYCEAYQQQQGAQQAQDQEDLSYYNAYVEPKSFVNTV